MSTLRILDAVFSRGAAPQSRRSLAFALIIGVGVHGLAALWAIGSAPSLETWSAELAVKVHAELTRAEVVDLPPPAPPPPPPPVNQPPPPPRTAPPVPSAKRAPSPARAGRILAASPSAVADLPATSFVTGTAATYAGGVTTATGKSDTAVNGPVDPGGGPGGPGDRSSPVEVQDTDWKCPWPREAETQQIDEQTVTIRVVVRADGSVESATALSDPGFGFAAAARACALAARYAPARDRSGRPVRAASPPILVHFSR